jgi:hypothetical protein
MPGKRAKILATADVGDLLVFASCTRHPLRNTVMVLLSATGPLARKAWQNIELPGISQRVSGAFATGRSRTTIPPCPPKNHDRRDCCDAHSTSEMGQKVNCRPAT